MALNAHNRNPEGRNQYPNCPKPDDPRVAELIRAYDRRGIFNRKVVSELLLSEHGISISDTTVVRRRRELGLKASGVTTKELPDSTKRQLVLDQMAKDTSKRAGPRTIKRDIFRDTGIQLTRDWIANEMRHLDPDAYSSRGPKHNKGRRPTEQRTREAARNHDRTMDPSAAGPSTQGSPPSTQDAPLSIAQLPTFCGTMFSSSPIISQPMSSTTHGPDSACPTSDIDEPGYLGHDSPSTTAEPAAICEGVDTVTHTLENGTAQLAAIQQALRSFKPRGDRQRDVLIRFRRQVESLLGEL